MLPGLLVILDRLDPQELVLLGLQEILDLLDHLADLRDPLGLLDLQELAQLDQQGLVLPGLLVILDRLDHLVDLKDLQGLLELA